VATLYCAALDDLSQVFDRVDDGLVDRAVEEIARARRIALYVLFEVMVLKLRARLGVTPEAMRANHTNLE